MKDNILYILLAVAALLGANYWHKKKYGLSLIDKLRGKKAESSVDAPDASSPESQALETAHQVDVVETPEEQVPTGTVYLTEVTTEEDADPLPEIKKIASGRDLRIKGKQELPLKAAVSLKKITL